jgi:AraC-like DNA-binding protein
MTLKLVELLPPLKGYIDKMWVFEAECRLPGEDMRMMVPDGRLLMLIPFRNVLAGQMDGREYLAGPETVSLVGIADLPAVVDTQQDGPIGIIGIDINALGGHRFFHLPLKEIKNQLQHLPNLLGKIAKDLEIKIAGTRSISRKVMLIQEFLLRLLHEREPDLVFEYCVRKIESSQGGISVKQLERETGYSGRWLNRKFEEKLGISPKNFSSVKRFQYYYHALLTNAERVLRHKEFYCHYYDESHFIREFKRYTGFSPTLMEHATNNFGRLFL